MSEFRGAHYEAFKRGESAGNEAVLALETRFGPHTRDVLRFMKTMSEHDMPGAKKLYTEPPDVKAPNFIGKFLLAMGKTPALTGGSPVYGYPVGALSVKGGNYIGVVYLCDDLKLRTHADAVGKFDASRTELVTDLDETPYYVGQFYEHEENLPMSSTYYRHNNTKFLRMPITEVLNKIETTRLKTS